MRTAGRPRQLNRIPSASDRTPDSPAAAVPIPDPPCSHCGQFRGLADDRSVIRVWAGEMRQASLDKLLPPGEPVCIDCATHTITAAIVREVNYCEKRGIRWGAKRNPTSNVAG